MDTTTIAIVIAVVALGIAVLALVGVRRRKSDRLRSTFGPEYERALEDSGDRHRAEAELREREKRVKRLEIRPLTQSQRERFVVAWTAIQAEFVDEPHQALAKADTLLTDVMRERGYPMEDFEQRSADLSVDHPAVVQNYRAGHAIAERDDRNTENLRQAMLHYRTLFNELVTDGVDEARRAS